MEKKFEFPKVKVNPYAKMPAEVFKGVQHPPHHPVDLPQDEGGEDDNG